MKYKIFVCLCMKNIKLNLVYSKTCTNTNERSEFVLPMALHLEINQQRNDRIREPQSFDEFASAVLYSNVERSSLLILACAHAATGGSLLPCLGVSSSPKYNIYNTAT